MILPPLKLQFLPEPKPLLGTCKLECYPPPPQPRLKGTTGSPLFGDAGRNLLEDLMALLPLLNSVDIGGALIGGALVIGGG